ncbi:VPLPA-CTERM sorting domain-containing protein [Paracoccus sp. (in: a-proteobacteria)]|uniref:VPLPA-CTERM sorting domain-containing protein n=1 Tax=Paracoccus sp. TaxID=267 RepID=UPI003A8A7F83
MRRAFHLDAQYGFFTALLFLICILLPDATRSATFQDVIIDRSAVVLGGTGFLSEGSVTGFGPTVIDPDTGLGYVPGVIFDALGLGTASFLDIGFPPTTFLAGAIVDAESSTGLMTFLVADSASNAFFAIDLRSAIIQHGIFSPILQIDPAAVIRVYAANAVVVPLPAGAVLLAGSLLMLTASRRRRRDN